MNESKRPILQAGTGGSMRKARAGAAGSKNRNEQNSFPPSPTIAALSPVLDRFGRQRRPGAATLARRRGHGLAGRTFDHPKIERIQQDRLVVVVYIQATPQAPPRAFSWVSKPPSPLARQRSISTRAKYAPKPFSLASSGDDRRSDVAEVRRFATGGAARQGLLSRRVPGKASTGSTRYHDDSIRSAAPSSFKGGGASAEANCLFLIGGRQGRDSEGADSAACQYWWHRRPVLGAGIAAPAKKNALDPKERGYPVSFDERALLIEGRRELLISGEIHYPRVPEGEWERVLDTTKAAGINCIATYVFWNQHE